MKSPDRLAMWALAAVLPLTLLLPGCNDDDGGVAGDGGAGNVGSGTFFALLNGIGPNGEDGALELELPVPGGFANAATGAAGTLDLLGTTTTVTLTGFYDPDATPALALAGPAGEYRVEGDVEAGELVGTYSGPGGAGTLVALDPCEFRMVGDWEWSGAMSVDCEVAGLDSNSSGGFVRYTLNDGVLGSLFASVAKGEVTCPFNPVPGTCSDRSYVEKHDETGGFSDCVAHLVSTLEIMFGEDTFEGTYHGTSSVSGTECELVETCSFTQVLHGQRTTEYPTCQVPTRESLKAWDGRPRGFGE